VVSVNPPGGGGPSTVSGGGDLTARLLETSLWTDQDVADTGIPIVDVPMVTIGGGMGSFVLVDYLRMSGLPTHHIKVLAQHPVPYQTYRYLASNSQITPEARIRSDSSSIMDNVWGWPGYAVREAFGHRPEGFFKPLWDVFTEPIIADYWTPQSQQVFRSVDREVARISYGDMVVLGLVRMVRKRVGGGYFVVHTPPAGTAATRRVAYRCHYVHIGVGYPGLRFLPDLQKYRQAYNDYSRVVNAYEPHDHVYEELRRQPRTVVVRGAGIVGSRVLSRLIHDRENMGADTQIWHLFRNYVAGPQGPIRFRRFGELGWAYQGFNYNRASWGGVVKHHMEKLEGKERVDYLQAIGGTHTAWRKQWQDELNRGRQQGFYKTHIGEVEEVTPGGEGMIVTRIRSRDGALLEIPAHFIIDATGLEGTIDEHRVLADLLQHSGVSKNPYGRLDVERWFEVRGTRSEGGRMYASGSITLGGYYAPVDTFLGLQYVALQICDDLARLGFVNRFGPRRSVSNWIKWARNTRLP
jgi:hypothetical protein